MISTCRNCGKPNGAYAGFPQGDRCTCGVGVWSSLKEMTEQFEQAKAEVDAKINAAILSEREACAKVCEEVGPKEGSLKLITEGFAAAIRARNKK